MRKIEKHLRERIKELETECREVNKDRDEFRSYFSGKFRWFLEIYGKGQSPSMKWLIEDMVKFISRVQRWD